MASKLTKAIRNEAKAYADRVSASAAVILHVTEHPQHGDRDDETAARLRRRADAMRIQWLAAARELEAVQLKADAR
ncbi:hypothetical protein SEA_ONEIAGILLIAN_102 [Microbacterium phage OneinaGillian]|uniref:Uncharacterized protein n=1 Tax=Microbacterium phage OneinaGillian TaxID=2301604 RepID=A0A385UEF8_9CAUD|nr:hypothetical protein HOU23_gp102 [Microbacterium phage OneinaGillian]QJD53328.1 hypothetical protein SEA_TEMPO_107 [Microbacterium phage Tempo]QKO02857.1 hypothetical protein SEA_KELCOLE_105 [Microbacterium phage Kelcole]UOW92852.1 hypothetical protein SEA_ROBINROSE_109 [Microbacterium phage RobinRose]WNN94131.1 hypothetical protein SEA_FREGLEY_106 [Microbacterium phage Fregley]WNT44315.1 hypothetical protein SEA_CANDC_105 [Microbacterium phage CandC]